MNWQPIETAPESRYVVVWDGYKWYKAIKMRRREGGARWCYGSGSMPMQIAPTHWCEITPPTVQAEPTE